MHGYFGGYLHAYIHALSMLCIDISLDTTMSISTDICIDISIDISSDRATNPAHRGGQVGTITSTIGRGERGGAGDPAPCLGSMARPEAMNLGFSTNRISIACIAGLSNLFLFQGAMYGKLV